MDGAGSGSRSDFSPKALRCRHCGKPLQHTFIDLGMSPLCESFLTEEQLGEPETYYPLHVRVCDACWLVQLPEFVSPAHIFTEYAYFSSYSTSWVAHAKRLLRKDEGPARVFSRKASSSSSEAMTATSCSIFSRWVSECLASNPPPTWRRPLAPRASRRAPPSSTPKRRETNRRRARPRGLDRRQQCSRASSAAQRLRRRHGAISWRRMAS